VLPPLPELPLFARLPELDLLPEFLLDSAMINLLKALILFPDEHTRVRTSETEDRHLEHRAA
jgi:hypothetical protein